MSDIASSSLPNSPRSIVDRLHAFRRKVLTWLLVDGMCKCLLLLIGLIAFDLLVDWLFHLDYAQRVIMLILCAAAFIGGVYYWLVRPLRRRPNDDALLLQVESKHRDLRQVMISALQFSRLKTLTDQGVSLEMVAATIDQGAKAAEGVNFSDALDSSRFRLNSALLLLCLLALGGLAVGVAQHVPLLDIWFNRNVMLGTKEWWRDTYLIVEGLNEEGKLVLTRGEDHNQVVVVDEKSEVIPEQVFIEFRDGGARSMEEMTRTEKLDGRQFELLFRNVSTKFQFRAVGGRDGRTDWIDVALVDPPSVESLEMTVIPPDYTEQSEYTLPPGSGPYNVYLGSALRLKGTSNKALQEASLQVANTQWPLELTGERSFELSIPADQLVAGTYEFRLVDQAGLTASRPDTFAMRIRPDREPRILARTNGISGMVVPRAQIPIEASVSDDFAVMTLKLVYEWRGTDSNSIPQSGEVTFRGLDGFFGEAEIPFDDLFDLEPLNIPAGAGLTFALVATDNDAISGANEGRSADILLRVVTEEELRTDLLRREREQRQELERLLKTQEGILIETTAMLADVKSGQDSLESLSADMRANLLQMMRTQRVLGTNLSAIASRFQSFLIEVINNRIDEEKGTLRRRLQDKIITPLQGLDQFEVQDSIRGIELSRRSLDKPEELEKALEETVEKQREVVAKINEVLEAMVKAEGYQEAVNLLNEIKRAEEEVHRLTKERREQRIRDILERGGGAEKPQDDSSGDNNDGSGDNNGGDSGDQP